MIKRSRVRILAGAAGKFSSPGFTEVIHVLSQKASRGFTLFRMKNVCINMILCFSLSESDNAQENRTDLKRSINRSSDSKNKI